MSRHDLVSAQNHAEGMQYPWRFCVSTKGGSGGGGNVNPKGESSMVVSGLDV